MYIFLRLAQVLVLQILHMRMKHLKNLHYQCLQSNGPQIQKTQQRNLQLPKRRTLFMTRLKHLRRYPENWSLRRLQYHWPVLLFTKEEAAIKYEDIQIYSNFRQVCTLHNICFKKWNRNYQYYHLLIISIIGATFSSSAGARELFLLGAAIV